MCTIYSAVLKAFQLTYDATVGLSLYVALAGRKRPLRSRASRKVYGTAKQAQEDDSTRFDTAICVSTCMLHCSSFLVSECSGWVRTTEAQTGLVDNVFVAP